MNSSWFQMSRPVTESFSAHLEAKKTFIINRSVNHVLVLLRSTQRKVSERQVQSDLSTPQTA